MYSPFCDRRQGLLTPHRHQICQEAFDLGMEVPTNQMPVDPSHTITWLFGPTSKIRFNTRKGMSLRLPSDLASIIKDQE